MALLTTRVVAATVAAMTTRVRKGVGDRNSERYTNMDIYEAIDKACAWMHNEMGVSEPMTIATDLAYTGGLRTVALPAGVNGQNLYYIEDITDTNNPLYVEYTAPDQLDKFPKIKHWSIVDGALSLRPVPTEDQTLRLHTFAGFIPVSVAATPSTDQLATPANFESLIEHLACLELATPDDPIPKSRLMIVQDLKRQFSVYAEQHKGRQYVQDVRGFQWR